MCSSMQLFAAIGIGIVIGLVFANLYMERGQ